MAVSEVNRMPVMGEEPNPSSTVLLQDIAGLGFNEVMLVMRLKDWMTNHCL